MSFESLSKLLLFVSTSIYTYVYIYTRIDIHTHTDTHSACTDIIVHSEQGSGKD